MTSSNNRESQYPIDKIFLDRWSPRAYSNETMPEKDLLTILEAAHWAPSASNLQPWRFVYALRGSENWDKFLDLLIEFNQGWAKSAAALLFVISRTHSGELGSAEQKPSYSHSFDAGTAWGFLAMQPTAWAASMSRSPTRFSVFLKGSASRPLSRSARSATKTSYRKS